MNFIEKTNLIKNFLLSRLKRLIDCKVKKLKMRKCIKRKDTQ